MVGNAVQQRITHFIGCEQPGGSDIHYTETGGFLGRNEGHAGSSNDGIKNGKETHGLNWSEETSASHEDQWSTNSPSGSVTVVASLRATGIERELKSRIVATVGLL